MVGDEFSFNVQGSVHNVKFDHCDLLAIINDYPDYSMELIQFLLAKLFEIGVAQLQSSQQYSLQ